MFLTQVRVVSLSLILSLFSLTASANSQADHPGQVQDDSALVQAVQSHHNEFYVEAGNLVATKLLPDDTNGLPHQKWEARLSSGMIVTVVYNSDMGDRVPIKVGDKFGVGGQFIATGKSGIVHWLHDDPRGNRPDGYVYLNGVIYGDTDHEDGLK